MRRRRKMKRFETMDELLREKKQLQRRCKKQERVIERDYNRLKKNPFAGVKPIAEMVLRFRILSTLFKRRKG